MFKLIGRFFHIPGVLCVLQNFALIRNYVFHDLVRLQLIIWPYNFTKSWFLGVEILYKFCRILWDTPCFRRGMRILFNYSCLFVIILITGSGSPLGLYWLSRVEPLLFKQVHGVV